MSLIGSMALVEPNLQTVCRQGAPDQDEAGRTTSDPEELHSPSSSACVWQSSAAYVVQIRATSWSFSELQTLSASNPGLL